MKVEEIQDEGVWPILAGGTHYYVQSLLFKNTTLHTGKRTVNSHSILSAPTSELFAFLKSVDPQQASKLHPSDRRKVQSKVELYLNTGKTASELYKTQRESGVHSRWDTLIFWVWSERDVLNERLDKRVDKMVERRIEEECRELYKLAQETGAATTHGVFQAIGIIPKVPDADDRISGVYTGHFSAGRGRCGQVTSRSNSFNKK